MKINVTLTKILKLETMTDDISASHTPSKAPDIQRQTTDLVGWKMREDQDKVEIPWPERLPKPPSMSKLETDNMEDTSIPMYTVFNANTPEGAVMVRVLSEKGFRVVAVVRVFVSKTTQELIKLKRVTAKVASGDDQDALHKAVEGCERAFLVNQHWERFDNLAEEQMAHNILNAVARANIKQLVMICFEDIQKLQALGIKSQLVPSSNGLIHPTFEGMKGIDTQAQVLGISLSHVLTSYVDLENERKSLTVVRGPRGKIIAQSYFKDPLDLKERKAGTVDHHVL